MRKSGTVTLRIPGEASVCCTPYQQKKRVPGNEKPYGQAAFSGPFIFTEPDILPQKLMNAFLTGKDSGTDGYQSTQFPRN